MSQFKKKRLINQRVQHFKQRHSCQRKQAFLTLEEAQSASNPKKLYINPNKAYSCGICGKFHLVRRDKHVLQNDVKELLKDGIPPTIFFGMEMNDDAIKD